MERLSKRQQKRITHFLREKAERAKSGKFRHRSSSGDGRRRESTVGLLAARVDKVVIVASFVSPQLKRGFIDRVLVISGMEKAEPVIVFNKVDLLADRRDGEEVAALYRSLGYRCCMTSAVTGEGIALLKEEIRDSSSLLAGHSGVGKSSLLNALLAGKSEKAEVKEVSATTNKGVHTTTSVKVYQMDGKTTLLDLPGVKLVSLYDLDPASIGTFFPEFTSWSRRCRYTDCLHTREPECGVKQGLAEGEIDGQRYESYVRMVENPWAES